MASPQLPAGDKEASGINTMCISPAHIHIHPNPTASSTSILEEDEKQNINKSSDGEDDDNDEDLDWENEDIAWHYLTFETELPSPTSLYPSKGDGTELAPCPPLPDLKKYTSPFDWSERKKSITIWISCVITSLTAFTAGAYSPGVGQMTEEWGVSNVECLVGITTFCIGFAVAPMILAPFSEINGRRPVFIASGILFVISQLCTGLTRSYAGMLVVRFFVGVGGSTFSTMVGGVVSDIYHTEDRNKPMALFSGGALFGTGFGPLVCGFIAERTTWRWIFYMQTIVDGLIVVLIIITFQETRGNILLSRKARALNRWYEAREAAGYYGFNLPISPSPTLPSETNKQPSPPTTTPQRLRWKVKSDEDRATLGRMIAISLYRPFHLLVTEPVVFWFSLWVAFSWAVLYLTLAAIPLAFQRNHGFTLSQANAVFAALCIGAIFATVLSIYQEKIAKRHGKLQSKTPEDRLYFACVESAAMPIGLFVFGWTASPDVHWVVPAVSIGVATVGIFSIYLSVFNYLADTYHRYASSALAAQSFCRNILGGIFPIITTKLYNDLDFGPASSLLGGIGTLLTIVPWILVFYGPQIRARSKFASEIMHGEH